MSENLKKNLEKTKIIADFHTLGYGSDHNPNVCLSLTEANTGIGTF